MGRRVSTQSKGSLVDEFINTAYDDVKIVADNIDSVIAVANAYLDGDFTVIIDNIDSIVTVDEHIAEVIAVADDIAHVVTVSSNITDVNTVAADIVAVTNVHNNMPAILNVSNNMADILMASEYVDDIQGWLAETEEARDVAVAASLAASTSEANALASENAAGVSETNAATSESNALVSEGNADSSAADALAEADRAAAIAITLNDAIRNSGQFDPTLGSYPIPTDQTVPYTWFSTNNATIDSIIWTEGDMLMYVPATIDPVNTFGSYYRVAGELAGADAPLPLELLDHLIMAQGKHIYFRNNLNELVQTVTLDQDGDLVLGDAYATTTPVTGKIGLATPSTLHHIKEMDEDGKGVVVFDIITNEAGEVSRVGHTHIEADITDLDKYTQVETNTLVADALTTYEETASTKRAAMTKADFFANAEMRKRESAGSGFLEWGKHLSNPEEVNQGLWTLSSTANTMRLGREEDGEGVSRTGMPITLVNGVVHKVAGVNWTSATNNQIEFPPAPDGTKTYDSATGEVVDFTVDVDPKYGDVASDHNEAVARAFEGEYYNGDFRFEDDGSWRDLNEGISIVDEQLVCDGTNATKKYITNIGGNVEDGQEYEMTISIAEITSGFVWMSVSKGSIQSPRYTKAGEYKWRFTADHVNFTSVHPVAFAEFTNVKINSCSLRKVTNQVITSRQDYCFLETFHEVISDKGVVFPLGNVQYGATPYEGIALQSYNTVQSYSAFGEWDNTTTGRSAVWDDLTDAEKQLFLSEPENNIYFDSEVNELVQVRYRIRVIEGFGDAWDRLRPSEKDGVGALQYGISPPLYVRVKGTDETVPSDLIDSGQLFYQVNHPKYQLKGLDVGIATCHIDSTQAHNALCFALPICLVQRLNQGAYHPAHNPDGFARWSTTTTFDWYQLGGAGYPSVTTADCLTPNVGDALGYDSGTGDIDNGTSGRSDQYEFYDAIYAGQVQDLRITANKQDTNRLLEDGIRKAVAGETRGKGKVPFSTVYDDAGTGDNIAVAYQWQRYGGTGNVPLFVDNTDSKISVGEKLIIWDETLGIAFGGVISISGSSAVTVASEDLVAYIGELPATGTNGTGNTVLYFIEKELSAEYDSLPWVDIIGSPENILATFRNGCVGQWVPVLPTGGTLEYPANRKNTSEDVFQVYTNNNGGAWTANSITGFDEVTNSRFHNYSTTHVGLWYYETLTDFTKPDVNTPPYGEIGKVWATARETIDKGNRLVPSVTGLICKSQTTSHDGFYAPLLKYSVGTPGTISSNTSRKPIHTDILGTSAPQNESPAVKALYHLVEKDGLLYIQYHASQLVYTTDNWGDDLTVTILDNESTQTDLNGVTVKVVTHTEQFPIGIADYTQTN